MEYKNFKWKFANLVICLVGIIFFILFLIIGSLFIYLRDYKLIFWTIIVMIIMLIPLYLISLLIGNSIYKKNKIIVKEEGICQNNRLLKYENIDSVFYSKLISIYYFQMTPIVDGVFASKRVLLYFYSQEELYHFIIVNDLIDMLSKSHQQILISIYMLGLLESGEEIDPILFKHIDKQRMICPCCGNKTLFKKITNEICPVCFWENDMDKGIIYNPNMVSEINHMSLIEAKRNYEKFGACDEKYIDEVRKPFSFEIVNEE